MWRSALLLECSHSVGRGGHVEAPHVLVHLGEAFLQVLLGAALSDRPETETLGWMMKLEIQNKQEEMDQIYWIRSQSQVYWRYKINRRR